MELLYTAYNNEDCFRKDFLEQLNHGVLGYNFVNSYRNDYLQMLEVDLRNYKANEYDSCVVEKIKLHQTLISAIKANVSFRKEFEEFSRKISNIIKKDVEHSEIMKSFFNEIEEIYISYNL